MTENQVQNIFASYSQANDSTSRKFGGTGLGLSISKQLVELMNGEIKVHSTKDVGSSFTFNILFQLSDSENKRQYRLPTSGLLGKKILIIDSANKNVISLIRSLGYFKYKTHSIPSFEEAVLEKDIKYDIIIINQLSITRYAIDKMQEMKERYDSKVVVLSELYSSLNSELLEDFKVDTYLRTPLLSRVF
jgi:aminoglycoside/choline kinase family phosphotransferase